MAAHGAEHKGACRDQTSALQCKLPHLESAERFQCEVNHDKCIKGFDLIEERGESCNSIRHSVAMCELDFKGQSSGGHRNV